MKKSKRIFLLLVIFMLIFTACDKDKKSTDDKVETKDLVNPLIYKVTKKESDNVIYLFGSIHVADDTAYPLPKKVMNAYADSDYLAVEADIVEFSNDIDAQLALLQNLTYTDGTKINDHLSPETYNALVEYLKEKSSYVKIYDSYKPYFFLSLLNDALSNEAGLTSDGIDEYLLKMAKKDSKEILEVESVDEQVEILLGFSDELYELMFKSNLASPSISALSLKNLYNAWKSGNYEIITLYTEKEIDLNNSTYTDEQIKILNNYNKLILTDRNISMAEKLIEYFESDKKVLFTVGVSHLVGDKGIIKLLEENGYTVELIK